MPKQLWSDDIQERFAAFLDKGRKGPGRVKRCWIWTGATNAKGYGIFRMPWGVMRAHRMAYLLHHNLPRTAIDGIDIHHASEKCVTACCNPFHLVARDGHGHDIEHNKLRARSQKETGRKFKRR